MKWMRAKIGDAGREGESSPVRATHPGRECPGHGRAPRSLTGLALLALLGGAAASLSGQERPASPDKATGSSQPATARWPNASTRRQVNAFVTRAIEGKVAPGLVLGISHPDAAQPWILAQGRASLEHPTAMPPEAVLRYGSLTGTFTALLIADLVESGELRFEDRLATHLPAWKTIAPEVSIEQLLRHTHGLPEAITLPAFESLRAQPDGLEAVLQAIRAGPVSAPAGEGFRFGASGPMIAAQLAETKTGVPYEKLLRQRVLAPLGAHRVQLDDPYRILRNRVPGHEIVQQRARHPAFLDPRNFAGGMGLSGRVADLLALGRELSGGGRVLKPETLARVRKPHRFPTGERLPYGLGVDLEPFRGRPAVSHGGILGGHAAWLSIDLETGICVAPLGNAASFDVVLLAERALTALLRAPPPGAPDPSVALHGEWVGEAGDRFTLRGPSEEETGELILVMPILGSVELVGVAEGVWTALGASRARLEATQGEGEAGGTTLRLVLGEATVIARRAR